MMPLFIIVPFKFGPVISQKSNLNNETDARIQYFWVKAISKELHELKFPSANCSVTCWCKSRQYDLSILLYSKVRPSYPPQILNIFTFYNFNFYKLSKKWDKYVSKPAVFRIFLWDFVCQYKQVSAIKTVN